MKNKIAWAFRALADPSRVEIFGVLLEGNKNVTEVVRATGLSQPRVSRHLRILREAGLVEPAREGKWVSYKVGGNGIPLLKSALEELKQAGGLKSELSGSGFPDEKRIDGHAGERKRRGTTHRARSNEEDRRRKDEKSPAPADEGEQRRENEESPASAHDRGKIHSGRREDERKKLDDFLL